jgi:hypothetical protein
MGEDACCSISPERLLHDLARVNTGAVDCPAEEFLPGNDAVTAIEVDDSERLVRTVTQLHENEIARPAG